MKGSILPFVILLATFHSNASGGLIASYSFEDNFLDSSGFGNDGGLLGGNTSVGFAPGLFGQAASFNGIGSVGSGRGIRVPHSNSLNLSSAMTLAAWVNPTNANDPNVGVIFKGDLDFSFGAYDLLIGHFPSGQPGNIVDRAGTLLNNDSVNAVSPAQAINLGAWQHLATTFDGSDLRLFINGVEVASTPFTGTITQEMSPLWIGQRFDPRFLYAGLIDEVRIYDTALSSSEIAALAEFPASPSPVPEPSSLALLGIGAFCLVGFRLRRRGKPQQTNKGNAAE